MDGIRDFNPINILTNDIYSDVLLLPENRRGFNVNNGIVTLPIFFYRIIGIEQDSEREYYNDLFNMDLKLKSLNNMYLKVDYRLDTFVSGDVADRSTGSGARSRLTAI